MASGAPTPEQLARLAQLAVLFDAIKANRVVNVCTAPLCLAPADDCDFLVQYAVSIRGLVF